MSVFLQKLKTFIGMQEVGTGQKSRKKWGGYLIGACALLFSGYFIFGELSRPGNTQRWEALMHFLRQPAQQRVVGLVVVLMLLNWTLEVVKWRYLIRPLQRFSWPDAVLSLLAGLSLALFTPARVGEYGGRVLYLHPENRFNGVVLMGIGGFSQLLVTALAGLSALSWYLPHYVLSYPYALWLPTLSLFIAALMIYGYFNSSLLTNLKKLSFFKKMRPGGAASPAFVLSSFALFQLLGLSALRYIVFSGQYHLLLRSFLGPLPVIAVQSGLSIVFLVQSLLPSFALADLGIKGASAAYLLGTVLGDQARPAVFTATLAIWIINIIVPSLVGSILLAAKPYSISS